jgi:hypothetical protein
MKGTPKAGIADGEQIKLLVLPTSPFHTIIPRLGVVAGSLGGRILLRYPARTPVLTKLAYTQCS